MSKLKATFTEHHSWCWSCSHLPNQKAGIRWDMPDSLERLHSSHTLCDGMERLAQQQQPTTPTRSTTPLDSGLKNTLVVQVDTDVFF